MLIHGTWGIGINQLVEVWRGLIDAQAAGKVRHLGVSNFVSSQIEHIEHETGVRPAVHQLEFHPVRCEPCRTSGDPRSVPCHARLAVGAQQHFPACALVPSQGHRGHSIRLARRLRKLPIRLCGGRRARRAPQRVQRAGAAAMGAAAECRRHPGRHFRQAHS
eukprot:2654866-Prymnesium_polylepis.1